MLININGIVLQNIVFTIQGGKLEDLFEWIDSQVIPNMYFTEHYNDNPLDEYDRKFIDDGYYMRLGPPRLRLIRVKPGQ